MTKRGDDFLPVDSFSLSVSGEGHLVGGRDAFCLVRGSIIQLKQWRCDLRQLIDADAALGQISFGTSAAKNAFDQPA
ncbi:MAG: hypothetical protein P4L68_10300 [Methylovirgula sp.]|nr:hypothetical protein [Methylovirgula sp.]